MATQTKLVPKEVTRVNVYEISDRRIYQAFVKLADPTQVLKRGREEIASQLMVEDDFERKKAYYTADKILGFAQRLIDSGQLRLMTPPKPMARYSN
jgi:hypothetical protein